VDEQDSRPAIVQHIYVVVGAQHGVYRHRDGSHFDSAKECRGKLWGVKQQQGHALFHIKAQVEQPITYAVGKFRDLRIGICLAFMINSGFLRPSLVYITI